MSSKLKVVFAGTPEFAAGVLQSLLDSRHEVIACYTQPDRPAGRGRKLTPSPVKALALEHNVDVFQPLNFKQQADVDQLKALNADIMVVVAYGLILPKTVLEAPHLGCINVHASILPRWRGAAPIQRAIAAGDAESGVTIMQMDEGLDTGDMLLKSFTPISNTDTGGSLHDRLAEMGAKDALTVLDKISAGQHQRETQNDADASYAHKLSKEEAKLDWNLPATQLHNLIRAFTPWPVCHTELAGDKIRVWQAEALSESSNQPPGTIISAHKNGISVACSEGVLRLQEVQLSGGKRLPVSAILNSKAEHFSVGKQFS